MIKKIHLAETESDLNDFLKEIVDSSEFGLKKIKFPNKPNGHSLMTPWHIKVMAFLVLLESRIGIAIKSIWLYISPKAELPHSSYIKTARKCMSCSRER